MDFIIRLIGEEEGVTLIEYALIAVIISIAVIVILTDIGNIVRGFYQSVADAFP